jgi:acyl carrier protein
MTALQHDRVLDMLATLCTVPRAEIREEHRLREDLGMDSVGSIELLSMLAEEFDLEVEMGEVAAVRDVGGVLALARRHLPAAPRA